MNISFKSAEETETGVILNFMIKLYDQENIPFNEKEMEDSLRKLLKNDIYGKAFLIYADGSAAGYLIITFGYSIEFKGKDALIDELYIDKNFRGKGLGTEALKYAEKVCSESGVKAIHLEVEHENYKAQSVYRKFGFKDHSRYLMTKWI
jgi:ribosomal protein S18 acetylase RimI-like enzyme